MQDTKHKSMAGRPGDRRALSLPKGSGVTAAGVVAFLAAVLFLPGLDAALDGLSFDLLFRTRFATRPSEVVLISLDAESYEDLNSPKRAPLNRQHHAALLRRLAAAGARAVVFDMVFDDSLAAEDAEFAEALKMIPCIIGAEHFRATRTDKERLVLPVPALRTGAAGWGLVNLELQGGWTARSYRLWEDVGDMAVEVPQGRARSLALRAWELAGFGSLEQLGAPQRIWLNYYGSRDTLESVSYSDALDPKRKPDKLFAGKVVFVGSRLSIGNAGTGKDEFATPYSLFDHSATHGVEIHATAFLNLLRGEWLTRTPLVIERTGLVLLAALFGAMFINWPPYRGMLVAMLAAVIVAGSAWYCFEWQRVWFAWVKVVVVIAAAYGWAVIYNFYRTHIENVLFRQAIARHLSPSMVERVLSDPSVIIRKGEKWTAAYLFSDIEGSTAIANMTTPTALMRALNDYYDAAVEEVHAQDGMVEKFLGDGMFAMWNVPFEQPDFRRRALTAAVGLKERVGNFEATGLGLRFRTRIGLHCGEAIVGNCGGKERFEFTAVGVNVNLASRLEGANRKLGTQVLASHETVEELEQEFVLREIGYCRLRGVDSVKRLYEVLGVAGKTRREEWIAVFEEGVGRFRRRDFAGANGCFQRVLELKPGDGPSGFYGALLKKLGDAALPEGWLGEIDLT